MIQIYTIGFTKKTARKFFESLKSEGVQKLVDVRLNNVSQLAGFAKRDDLSYLLDAVCGIKYIHRLDLAPTQDMLDAYKKERGTWGEYEARFRSLIEQRAIERSISRDMLDGSCLLCSEDTPHFCHRRIVAEYLAEKWGDVEIKHII